ncbi:MAG: alpha/beta hydrolase [Pseudonocardiaceae bacterium]|nr:alpha/beta hydrolase [Pseudonocardiaceae bacterium]
MTSSHDDPTVPCSVFLDAFNAGDSHALERAYEPGAVLVPRPGMPVTGAGRVAANAHLLSMGGPMRAQVRHVYTAADIALLIVDWRLHGTAPDGTAFELAGTATDVARRGSDGRWRYVDVGTADVLARLPELGRRAGELAPTLRGYSEFWDIVSGCVGVPARWHPHRWPLSLDLPPTLLVSGAHDVATPRSWAENTHRQLPDSVLLRWDGAGHSAWQLNNKCATDATVDYLITGKLPAEGTVC